MTTVIASATVVQPMTTVIASHEGAAMSTMSRNNLAGQRALVTGATSGIALFGPTAEFDVSAFDKMFASNVRAPFFLVAAFAPGMAARGHGSIVSVSSMAGGVGIVGGAAYGATKASLEAMTRAWAAEYS